MDFDIAVLGGGPAGMMAAISAAEAGSKVVLLEKTDKLGKKLLITGKERCNITNAETDIRKITTVFGKKGPFLYTALHSFSNLDIINFFNSRGLETKAERGNRVFPKTDRSLDVLNVLLKTLNQVRVKVLFDSPITSIDSKSNQIERVVTPNLKIKAKKFIICTGGLSYPETGSTGDGMSWAKSFGHTVIKPTPALVPIVCKESWIKELQGLSLKNVKISVFQNNKKQLERFGEALFTHEGLSGPIVLDMSEEIGHLLENGLVEIIIDFKPALDFQTLDKRIQRDFKEFNSKLFKNSLEKLLPQKLIPVIINLSKINPKNRCYNVTKGERIKLLHLFKEFKLTAVKLRGFDKAIVTAGGVSLKEVDQKTMQSKIIKNLYFAGEILDLNGPTGGYNLQVCWSTGYLAGKSAAKDL